LPKEAVFGNNSGADLFAAVEGMLEGEILAAEGKTADAIKVLGWALYGLAGSLDTQGKATEAETVRGEWKKVWAKADIAITSSCLCAPGGREK
jgi:hypothetical protein